VIVDVDRELETFRDRHRVPAVGVAIVARDGTVSVRVAGVLHRGSDEPVRPDDRWHIGSCAKALTAALWARLVEAGHTSWDAPLGSFFPDLGVHPGWMERTVAEALTCTAGVRANPSRRDMKAAYVDTRDPGEQRTDAVHRALATAPRNSGRFLYSNLGYVVVGAAVDRVAGVPYEAALQTHLLDPLGVTTAGFGPPPRVWGQAPRLLAATVAAGRGSPMSPDNVRSDNPPLFTPAGRLHLTLADWSRFHAMVLADGHDILRRETIERLLTAPRGGRMTMGWAPAPQLDGVRLAMQGSNTMWSAAALMSADGERTALVVANDGRTRILTGTALLAHRLVRG
jgi:CubicO group peptidase (beta-lactamase class C family)